MLLRKCLNCIAVLIIACVNMAWCCRIERVEWDGRREVADELLMETAIGRSCDAWNDIGNRLVRQYENRGFLGAKLIAEVDSLGVLKVSLERGAAWVWAEAVNLDSGATKPDVFERLTGLEMGAFVSLSDLERSDEMLARLGYYERTCPVRLFRDPARNQVHPAYSMRASAMSIAEGFLTYSSNENVWEGNINVELYNILGTGRDLHMEGFTLENSRRLEGEFKEPWIFGTAWNVVARGFFDDDSSAKDALLEIGVSRNIGFDFSIAVFAGIGRSKKSSSFELSYVSLDRFTLPRRGMKVQTSLFWAMDRPDSLESYFRMDASVMHYIPLFGNFISRFSGAAGTLLPTNSMFAKEDLFALGGLDSFKGMQLRFLRTRAYGWSELAVLWQDGYNLSVEVFYQPGIYRRLSPGHGWAREHDYGVGFTQYRKSWSINLYYALRNGCDYLEGVLGFGVKTLF